MWSLLKNHYMVFLWRYPISWGPNFSRPKFLGDHILRGPKKSGAQMRKRQDCWPKIDIVKGNHSILRIQWMSVHQKVHNSDFQSDHPIFSKKKIQLKIGAHFLLYLFFDNFNFWRNFWWTFIHCIHKIQSFPFSMLIFGPNFGFLGPRHL